MILGKSMLRAAIDAGEIRLHDDHGNTLPEWQEMITWYDAQTPSWQGKDPVALQPASIDLHFGNGWLVPRPNVGVYPTEDGGAWVGLNAYTDAKIPVEYDTTVSDSFMIPAHGFVLVRTKEVIGLSADLFGKVEGRSSVGRLGLIVETAGVIDPGFYGSITLELCNVLPNPLRVYAGMRGCQITVSQVLGSTEGGYQSTKYQGQVKTTGTMLHRDFEA